MKIGDIVELQITSNGMNGEGVTRYNDCVVFVPLTLVGEVVMAQFTEVKKSFARAKVIKLIKASEYRVTPICPVFFQCGGCEMQHINYETQLSIKRQQVADCLRKELKVEIDVPMTKCGNQRFGYRNKIQVPISRDNDGPIVGYYKPNSHTIVPFRLHEHTEYGNCPLHNNVMQDIIDIFCHFVYDYDITTYDEKSHKGLVRHLVIRKIGDTYSITVVINGDTLPNVKMLIEEYLQYGLNFSLYLSSNTRDTNVILGDKAKVIYGNKQISGEVLGVKIEVSPLSFMQVNDEVRDLIYNRVIEIIESKNNSIVIDAYSGIGILSNVIARKARKVYAIEIIKDAVRDANRIAELNDNKEKIVNICGDVVEVMPMLMESMRSGGICSSIGAVHEMQLSADAFEKIKNNKKTIEIRLNDEKRQALNIGDFIIFNNKENNEKISVEVTQLDKFATFQQMFKEVDNIAMGWSKKNCNNYKDMYNFYTKEEEKAVGTVAISFAFVTDKTTLVLDPPRKGCEKQVIEAILKACPNRIIYISCNPASLARDVALLAQNYSITSVEPFDMFPMTGHVESVVCLQCK